EQRKRIAEAQKYEAEQRALAQNAESDATRYRLEQEAAGIKAKGEAKIVYVNLGSPGFFRGK
ncbi:MAG: hypothetical protein II763_01865, partial [Bacteroidales bacterium]|nr:hypothetical protein [Bacteroidales bacterium]